MKDLQSKLFGRKPEPIELRFPLDEKYREGQVWSYKTRPQDKGSTLVIGRVEKLPRRPAPGGADPQEEIVISVLVRGLKIHGEPSNEEVLEEISHLPLDRLALEASTIEMIADRERLPISFEEGYENWKLLFARGAAAYYKFPVSQCIELAERTFRSNLRPRGV